MFYNTLLFHVSLTKPDIKADMEAVVDRGESVSLMEPTRISESSRHRATLADLAVDLAARTPLVFAGAFQKGSLRPWRIWFGR